MRILESQQLVEIRRGRGGGAVVRKPGLEAVGRYVALLLQLRKTTLAHLEEVRSVIEPPAAEQAALHAEPDDLDTLVALHDAERAAESDPLDFVTAVTAFDQAVTELSGNQTLAVIAGVFRDIYAGQVYSSIGDGDAAASPERMARRVIVSHSAFIDAARRRDASLAQKSLERLPLHHQPIARQPECEPPADRHRAAVAGAGRAGERRVNTPSRVCGGHRDPGAHRRRPAPGRRPPTVAGRARRRIRHLAADACARRCGSWRWSSCSICEPVTGAAPESGRRRPGSPPSWPASSWRQGA